jgi:hypothetical protein
MEHSDLLRHVATTLDGMGVRYLVTGSTATIFFGEARFTTDIDVVAELTESDLPALMRAFPADQYYLSEPAARAAIRSGGQFNIIQPDSGLKVDVMVPADTPFNRSRLARAVRVRPGEYEASFASAEDVILKKMEYFREGGSDKHLRDIAGVLKVSGERVDMGYVAEWAGRLGLEEIWRAVLERVAKKP